MNKKRITILKVRIANRFTWKKMSVKSRPTCIQRLFKMLNESAEHSRGKPNSRKMWRLLSQYEPMAFRASMDMLSDFQMA